MSEHIETFARRFVASRAPWTRGEAEELILQLANELHEWRGGSAIVNARLLTRIAALEAESARLEAALMEIASYEGPDHLCDINAKNMRDTARKALGLTAETR